MANKIVGLRGEFVPEEGEPSPAVVEALERMLEEARAGHLHGLVGVCDSLQGVRWFVVGSGMGFDMIGGLELAKLQIVELIEKD